MPSAKSGTAGTADSPVDPDTALEALDDTSGDVSDTSANPAQTTAGNWDQTQVAAMSDDPGSSSDSSTSSSTSKNSWIGVDLKDDKGNPVPGEAFEVKHSDGTISSGTLDDHGRARVEGVPSGQCDIRFPRLHNSEWRKA
jgi:hypothetical protein